MKYLTGIFSPDKHWGYERKHGKLAPLHDQRAIDAMLTFAQDFQPDVWIEGGDNLDCGPVSHWLKDKTLSSQGLRMQRDMDEYASQVLDPIDAIMGDRPMPAWAVKKGLITGQRKKKLRGNHEAWLDQLAEREPGLDGMLDLDRQLGLTTRGWDWHEQGDVVDIGKLSYTHGDTVTGGDAIAKAGILAFDEGNLRFGHHHTYQVYTKHARISAPQARNAVAVPCLCHKAPSYGRKMPNKWMLGFNFFYVFEDGTFSDYTPIITNGRFAANGKVYKG
jgi:hypothetical protein